MDMMDTPENTEAPTRPPFAPGDEVEHTTRWRRRGRVVAMASSRAVVALSDGERDRTVNSTQTESLVEALDTAARRSGDDAVALTRAGLDAANTAIDGFVVWSFHDLRPTSSVDRLAIMDTVRFDDRLGIVTLAYGVDGVEVYVPEDGTLRDIDNGTKDCEVVMRARDADWCDAARINIANRVRDYLVERYSSRKK